MIKPKERITITMDPVLLERIDAVAEARGDSRSAVIERLLRDEIENEEGFLRKMENPVIGAVLRTMTSSPRVMQAIATLVGDSLSAEDAEAISKGAKKQAGLGRARSARAKRTGGMTAEEGS